MARKFDRPFFITSHAVERFREHISDLPRNEIIEVILEALQHPKCIEGIHGVYYGGKFNGKPFYIPVDTPLENKEINWPIVPTILGPESSMHRKIMSERRKRDEKLRKEKSLANQEVSRQECSRDILDNRNRNQ